MVPSLLITQISHLKAKSQMSINSGKICGKKKDMEIWATERRLALTCKSENATAVVQVAHIIWFTNIHAKSRIQFRSLTFDLEHYPM